MPSEDTDQTVRMSEVTPHISKDMLSDSTTRNFFTESIFLTLSPL